MSPIHQITLHSPLKHAKENELVSTFRYVTMVLTL